MRNLVGYEYEHAPWSNFGESAALFAFGTASELQVADSKSPGSGSL